MTKNILTKFPKANMKPSASYQVDPMAARVKYQLVD